MSTLKELLKDIPVDWKALGDISEIIRGVRVTKNDLISDGIYPVVSGGTGYMGYVNKYNRDANSITIAQYGTAGFVKWQAQRFWANDVAFTIFPKSENVLDKKYLYYFLISKQEYLYEISNKIAVPYSISKDKILQIQIPIPYPNNPEKSLAIQQEIVRVLDGLSEQNKQLTSSLAQEIDQRKKQYEYYREELFRFEGKEVEWKSLGDENIGKFTRGSGLQKKDFTEFGIGCIHYGQVYTYYNTYTYETKSFVSVDFAKNARKAKSGDIVIATTSENDDDVCKAVAWLGEEDIAVSSDACFYSHKFNPKYVSYYFQTEQFQKQKRKYITGTKVRRVNVNDLEKITIPNPDITEQERIVHLLDQFDEATQNIVAQLEKEIELRNKKYEYYRNLLLSFSN